MKTGKIRQISRYRGCGLIKSDMGDDVFFQRFDLKSATFDLLKEGQRVKFNIGLSSKGFQAHDIELI